MRGEGPDGGGEAAHAGGAVPELVGGAETHVYGEHVGGADMGGAVQRVGGHGDEGDPVHGHPVPAVGGAEGVEGAAEGRRRREGEPGGERGVWELLGRGGGGGDDAAGCAEDAADAGQAGMFGCGVRSGRASGQG